MKILTLFSIAILLAGTGVAAPKDLINWRNDGTGQFPDAQAPKTWNAENNLLWEMPFELSNACPILVGDRLFFTEEPATLICLDSKTGNLLWKVENDLLSLLGYNAEELEAARETIAESKQLDRDLKRKYYELDRLRKRSKLPEEEKAKREKKINADFYTLEARMKELSENSPYGDTVAPPTHPTNGYSAYTPVSDGKTVYASFGLGVVVAFTLDGERLWHTMMGDADHPVGGSTSPIIANGKLIVRFSDYVALDPKNGNELWRTPSKLVFGTPIEFTVEEESYLFTSLGDVIRVADGEKILDGSVEFRIPSLSWAIFNSPILDGERLYTARGFEGQDGEAWCFRIPSTKQALEANGLELLWRKNVQKDRYYASPVAHEGLLYILSANSHLSVLNADDGELVYEHKLEEVRGTSYSSISLVGSQLLLGVDSGTILLIESGREYNELARGQVSEFRSTPIFNGSVAYLRTLEGIQAISTSE